jgi:hypothetical protein
MPLRYKGGNHGKAPGIINLGIRWRWAVNFTHRPLYGQEKSPRFQTVPDSNCVWDSVDARFSLVMAGSKWSSRPCKKSHRLHRAHSQLLCWLCDSDRNVKWGQPNKRGDSHKSSVVTLSALRPYYSNTLYNLMQHNHSWKDNTSLNGSRIFIPNKKPSIDLILSQTIPFQFFAHFFFKIHFNIVTDLTNALPGNRSVNTVQHATIDEDVFSMSSAPSRGGRTGLCNRF